MRAFTKIEKHLGFYGGRMRQKGNEDRGSVNLKISDEDDQKIAVQGMCAELAFCAMVNNYPDLDENPAKLPAADCKLADDRTVDVKSTPYPNGKLSALPWKKNKPVDLYVLMVGSGSTWRFAGCATFAELIREENLGSLKRGGPQSYILEQKDLSPLIILKKVYPIETR